jgi:CPA1 family monovalent cation:H+ antiporter
LYCCRFRPASRRCGSLTSRSSGERAASVGGEYGSGGEATQPIATYLLPAAIGIVLVLLGRAAAIYPIAFLFDRTALRLDWITRHILFWGGLRGGLAMALALAAPAALAEHEELISVAFAVVAFSIFVQGLTMPRLLRKA